MNNHPDNPTPSDAESRVIAPELEKELQAMTTWNGEHSALWEKAIEQTETARTERAERHRRFWMNVRKPQSLALAMLLFVIIVAALLPAIGKARRDSPSAALMAEKRQADLMHQLSADSVCRDDVAKALPSMAAASMPPAADGRGRNIPGDARKKLAEPAASETSDRDAADVRQVIHKATLELSSSDVIATFAKAQLVLRADLDEYIENSSLTGEGPTAAGQLTLRIATKHLDEAMNQLRKIAAVKAEAVTGDDVTAQAVDLDARIRNERQVETEMLKLLEARRGAPLADVLALRDKLSGVRESIERLQGQRDHLARQVSLATVLVLIRAKNQKPDEPKPGVFNHFSKSIDDSWDDGVRTLADSLAWFVRVLVGGLAWWLIVAAAVFTAVRLIRRASTVH